MVSKDQRCILSGTLYEKGLVTFPVENLDFVSTLQRTLTETFGVDDLGMLHRQIRPHDLNSQRMNAFDRINSILDWDKLWFSLVRNFILDTLGPDLLIQRKLNLSVQCPNDDASQLGLHADTLSGQSPFEVVTWLPLSKYESAAGMYWFDRTVSRKIFDDMVAQEFLGLEHLRAKYWGQHHYLELPVGHIAVFTGSIFHGNLPHSSTFTRVSVNCRLKSLFSPEGRSTLNERGVGTFYKLLTESPITRIGREYTQWKAEF
jgi:sporadic carbohydrate cluster 2OG-Fe(II) oxygenase